MPRPGAVTRYEQAADGGYAANTGAKQPEQAGRHGQCRYPVPDLTRAPDTLCIVIHLVIPCPRILR
jgi:hypothetical protein